MSARPAADSMVDVIGDTPMLDCGPLLDTLGLSGRLLLKLEYLNPGSSKKDRAAKAMLLHARETGELVPGQPVVELTSGNTGTGLAIVCAALAHPFIAVMSAGNSTERAAMMRALGARVEIVAQAPGSRPGRVSGEDLARVEARAREITREERAFRADQFTLDSHVAGHFEYTGPEMWEQSGRDIDAFCDFVGSGGSFTGVTRFLRTVNPGLRAYVVEPDTAAVLSGEEVTDPGHRIQGGGYSMPDLPLLHKDDVTDYVQVSDEDAVQTARLLARSQGVFAGFSTGANVRAATLLLEEREAGNTVACLACDSGLKYLSTDLWEPAPGPGV